MAGPDGNAPPGGFGALPPPSGDPERRPSRPSLGLPGYRRERERQRQGAGLRLPPPRVLVIGIVALMVVVIVIIAVVASGPSSSAPPAQNGGAGGPVSSSSPTLLEQPPPTGLGSSGPSTRPSGREPSGSAISSGGASQTSTAPATVPSSGSYYCGPGIPAGTLGCIPKPP